MDVPIDTPPPEVTLIGPPNDITLCKELTIEMTNPVFDGNRQLEVISWELFNRDAQHDPIVLANIEAVLMIHTLQKNTKLTIPAALL
jgi:hypothetical protein